MSQDPKERRRRSDAQERRWAGLVGGTINPGSGSGWRKRQDVRSPGYLWEMKRTDNKSISIKSEDMEQLRHHALREGVIPAMHIEIGGYAGAPVRRYVLMEEFDWMDHCGVD